MPGLRYRLTTYIDSKKLTYIQLTAWHNANVLAYQCLNSDT